MTVLVWDPIDRGYEAGVDRGVVYPIGGNGVPWNGLVSVNEASLGGGVTEQHLDGVKYLNFLAGTDYQASVEALSAPEGFPFGERSVITGFKLMGQPKSRFDFTYRTGMNDGYKIHLVYDALATPTAKSNSTIGEQTDPTTLTWTIDALPVVVPGFKPTAHFVADSTRTPAALLTALENFLYGTTTEDASFPTVETLLTLFGG